MKYILSIVSGVIVGGLSLYFGEGFFYGALFTALFIIMWDVQSY